MERKLNEQWVLEINGVKHMVKAVEGICIDCFLENGSRCTRSDECPAGDQGDYIIKDLGILNDDGLLPCPFCGEYPVVQPENSRAGFGCHCDKCKCAVSGLHESMQEVMDEWNRRV